MNCYLLSLDSPSHSFELSGAGLEQVLVFVDEHEELQLEGADHADHPPVKTQSGFSLGSNWPRSQFSNISASPAHGAPPFAAVGLLQFRALFSGYKKN